MSATTTEPTKTAPRSARGQQLWAVLLVVDSFFVIIFGGALAAKIYQHWQAPAAASAKPRRAGRKAEKPPEPPAPAAEQAKAESPKPEPAKPEPEPKPEPKPAAAKAPEPPSSGPRPLRPSLLQSPPVREGAKPQGSTAAQAPAAAASPAKAVPTEFRIKSPGARTVELAGAFLVRSGGKKTMVSHPDGTWTLTLYLNPGSYRYWFLVNGKKSLDPENPKTDRGASVLTVGQ